MKKIFLVLVTLISFIFPQDCEEPSEVWFKISNDINNKNYGELIQVDMSWGYAGTDGINIYLFVYEKITGKELVVQFPIGYWEAERINKFKKYIPKENEEFDLEKYLKSRKSIEIKQITKVGD